MTTGPAELAEILSSPEKRDRWIVFTLLEIKTDLAQHIVEDKAQFGEIKEWKGTVSSSVGGMETIKNKVQGGWATLAIVAAILLFVIDITFKIMEHIK